MKKMACLIAVVVSCLALVGAAYATPGDKFPWGSKNNPASAGPPAGAKLVLNINLQLSDDPDSGTMGNNWAVDDFNQHVQVWQTGPDTFYVDVRYVGTFVTVAGPSPGAAYAAPGSPVTVAAGIEGNMEGGYQATITGSLKPNPSSKPKGNYGQYEYSTYPGWLDVFFNVSNFDQYYWGWQYHTPQNGTWINASTGNVGDIN